MNKTQLVDALAERLGDRRTAATAVDGLLDTIVAAVGAGESVSITGFGVFEARARAARVARNPRTGEVVDVAATTVPAFRPGTGFRSVVGGTTSGPTPRATPARARSAAAPEVVADAPAPAVEGTAKSARKAAKGRGFAARPTPEQPIPDLKAEAKVKAGKGSGKGSGKDSGRSSGKPSGKDSGKDSGKGKGKGKKGRK